MAWWWFRSDVGVSARVRLGCNGACSHIFGFSSRFGFRI